MFRSRPFAATRYASPMAGGSGYIVSLGTAWVRTTYTATECACGTPRSAGRPLGVVRPEHLCPRRSGGNPASAGAERRKPPGGNYCPCPPSQENPTSLPGFQDGAREVYSLVIVGAGVGGLYVAARLPDEVLKVRSPTRLLLSPSVFRKTSAPPPPSHRLPRPRCGCATD